MLLAADVTLTDMADVIIFNADGTSEVSGQSPTTIDAGGGSDTLDFSAIGGNLSFSFNTFNNGITVTGDGGFKVNVLNAERLIGGSSGNEVIISASLSDDELVIREDAEDNTRLVVQSNGTLPSIAFPKDVSNTTIELGAGLGDDSLTFQDLGANVLTGINVVGSTLLSREVTEAGEFVRGVVDDVTETIDDVLLGDDVVVFAGDTFFTAPT